MPGGISQALYFIDVSGETRRLRADTPCRRRIASLMKAIRYGNSSSLNQSSGAAGSSNAILSSSCSFRKVSG